MPRKSLLLAASLLLLLPSAAWAGLGKAGLWNISTSMKMAMHIPPAAQAEMQRMHVKMPTAQSFTSQVCMTQAEVDAAQPPAIDRKNMSCQIHVTSRSASSMTADTVCRGRMRGTGHMQVVYQGAEHYAGSNSFSGVMDGQPVSNSMTYKGDWVKADCGAVKPLHP